MKNKMFPAFLASLALLAGFAHAADAPRVRAEIQALLDEHLLAANAHDTDRFLATYLHDQTLVFANDGVIRVGWDEVRAGQLKAWKNGQSDVVYSYTGEAKFTILSPEAVVVTAPMASVRTQPDGQISHGEFVATTVWQKRSEGWRAVQVHESHVRK